MIFIIKISPHKSLVIHSEYLSQGGAFRIKKRIGSLNIKYPYPISSSKYSVRKSRDAVRLFLFETQSLSIQNNKLSKQKIQVECFQLITYL